MRDVCLDRRVGVVNSGVPVVVFVDHPVHICYHYLDICTQFA